MRAIWLAALFLAAPPAEARPYTIDDMLKAEGIGQVTVDPSERWAIVERRRSYESAPRFDFEFRTYRLLSNIFIADLDGGEGLEPAFPQDPRAGYWSAGFSPSGRRLAVFRLQDEQLSLGVLDMETRSLRWLTEAADAPPSNPRPIWIGDDQLLVITRLDGALPLRFSPGNHMSASTERLRRSAGGREAGIRIAGSGAYRNVGLATETSAIVRFDLRTDSAETIERGSIADMALSADGRHLAIVARGPAIQPYLDRPVDPAFRTRRQRLVVENLATGEQIEPCHQCDILPNLLSWSPAGANLLFYARRDDQRWQNGQLYRSSGQGRALVAMPAELRADVSIVGGGATTVHAGWAGQAPLVLARGTSDTVAHWHRLTGTGATRLPLTGADRLLLASDDEVYAASAAGLIRVRAGASPELVVPGTLEVARGAEGAVDDIGERRFLNPDLHRLPALVLGTPRRALSMDARTGAPDWSVDLPARATLLAAASRRRSIVYLTLSPEGVGTLMLERGGRSPRRLGLINRHLAGVDVPERAPIHSTGPGGRRLTHWLTLPRNEDPAPLVVLAYPGWDRGDGTPPPFDLSDLNSYANAALLAASGYAVLEPSLPTETAADRTRAEGSDLGSVTVATRVPDDFADDDYLDRMAAGVLDAVDAAVGTGRVDPARLAVYGHSFGGYGAIAIATRTNRFQAVIAADGAYNLLGAYGSIPARDFPDEGVSSVFYSWFEAGQGGLGVPPWRQIPGYVSRSPYFSVERIRTPVMLIHGEQDFIPVEEAEKMFMALHRIGRDAILVRYAGEGHTLFSPANIRDQWQRIRAFLETSLSRTGNQRPQ